MQSSQTVYVSPQHEATNSSSDLIYEGLRVQSQPAPFMMRVLALAIDYGLLYGASFVCLFIVSLIAIGGSASLAYVIQKMGFEGEAVKSILIGFLLVVLFGLMALLTDGYFVYFEYKRSGQTPGKKLLGLRVVTIDGRPLSFGKCVMRETLRYIDFMLVLPGLLTFVLTEKRQRLGDLLAGTMVIYFQHDFQAGNYLYMTQSDYDVLYEVLQPAPVPETMARAYLKFAYPTFIRDGRQDRYHPAYQPWELRVRQYLPHVLPETESELDQLTLLLFFAEYCQQTLHCKTS